MVCEGWRPEAQLPPGKSSCHRGSAGYYQGSAGYYQGGAVAAGERRLFCIGIERILYASVYVVEEGSGGSEELYGALEQVGRDDEVIGWRIADAVPL